MHYSTEVTDSNFSDGQKFGKPSSATATKSFMQSSSVIASKVCFGQSPRQYVLRLAGRTLATKVTSGKEDAELIDDASLQLPKDQSVRFGFSAGGLLFPFYVGVCRGLEEAGYLSPNTKLAGWC